MRRQSRTERRELPHRAGYPIPSSTDAATATTNNTGLSATSPTGNTSVQGSGAITLPRYAQGETERNRIQHQPEVWHYGSRTHCRQSGIAGENKIKKGSFLCIPYPSTQIQQNTHPQATAPSDSELFSENKKRATSVSMLSRQLLFFRFFI